MKDVQFTYYGYLEELGYAPHWSKAGGNKERTQTQALGRTNSGKSEAKHGIRRPRKFVEVSLAGSQGGRIRLKLACSIHSDGSDLTVVVLLPDRRRLGA